MESKEQRKDLGIGQMFNAQAPFFIDELDVEPYQQFKDIPVFILINSGLRIGIQNANEET